MSTEQESQRIPINDVPGWYIKRVDFGARVAFEVYEPDGPTWKSGEPRDTITVEYWRAETDSPDGYTTPARVGWPSTSDKRPEVALALAKALQRAAIEAKRDIQEAQA